MPRCFVIQPFNEEFDKLFEEVYAPAIRDAGMEPYRVDQQPHVSVPVENIEAGIKTSDACLADISTNNPNVWYELGFAIANGRPVVIVCSDERDGPLPFDVQHRNIIRYCAPPENAHEFRRDITQRLRTVHGERQRLRSLAEIGETDTVGGLPGSEAAAMISLASNCMTRDAVIHPSQIKHDLEPSGFNDLHASLALESLRRKGFVREVREKDSKGEEYTGFVLEDAGRDWLLENQQDLLRAGDSDQPISACVP